MQHGGEAGASTRLRLGRVRRPTIIAAIVLILSVKLLLLVEYGPVFVPDSGGYVAYARAILASHRWLYDASLNSSVSPILALRMIGYPAMLAGAMLLAGSSWTYLIVALQFAIGAGALCAIYRLGIALALPWWQSLAGVVAFATSDQLVMEQSILTDSLNADLVIVAVCLLATGALARRSLSPWVGLASGLLLAAAFLLREAMTFLALTFVPLLALRWRIGRSERPLRSMLACALVLVPLMGAAETYEAWNAYRTGQRFVTTGPQVTLTFALILAAKRDPTVFDADTAFDAAARASVHRHVFEEIAPITAALFDQGYRTTDIARMASTRYLATWRDRPLAMLYVIRQHISENVAKLAFRPLASVCTVIEWATKQRQCPDYRDLARAAAAGFVGASVPQGLFFVAQTCELTLSIGLFSAFLLGVPLMFVASRGNRDGPAAERASLLLALWLMYIGWFAIYAAVHLENRYMVPVVPLSILGGIAVWRQVLRRRGDPPDRQRDLRGDSLRHAINA